MSGLKQHMSYSLTELKLLLYVPVILSLSCLSKNSPSQKPKLTSTNLRTDFNILRKTLEEAHPGLYWYADSAAMDAYFDSTYKLIARDMTRIEFFKLLLPVIAKVKCVHTILQLPSAVNNRSQLHKCLPFDFLCQDGHVFIIKDFSHTGHERLEIHSINNISTKEILATLLPKLPADGYNETYKSYLLSTGAFREGYALYFGQPDSFTVNAANPGSVKSFIFTVKAIPPPQRSEAPNPAPKLPLQVRFKPDGNTAILALNTFEIETKKFRDTLRTIFKAIREKNSRNLIIDLRQNGGGRNDNVSALFSFIASAPFQHLKRAEINPPVFTYLKYFMNPQHFKNVHVVVDASGKCPVNDRYAGTVIKKPEDENVFKGAVVLLTSGHTTSAASEFAAISHFTKRAKIVGEETGGCYYGATGGNFINLKLPNSGLEVRIPTIRIFTAVDEDYLHQPKGRGTLPDYKMVPTVSELIDGKDVQLQFAFKILNN